MLGVTVGDSLVSDADQNLRDSLRDDVTEAREDGASEQELGAKRDEVIEEAVAARRARAGCAGARVALVAIGELPARGRGRGRGGDRVGGRRARANGGAAPPDEPGVRGRAPPSERLGGAAAWSSAAAPAARRLARRARRASSGELSRAVDARGRLPRPAARAEDDEDARDARAARGVRGRAARGPARQRRRRRGDGHRPVADRLVRATRRSRASTTSTLPAGRLALVLVLRRRRWRSHRRAARGELRIQGHAPIGRCPICRTSAVPSIGAITPAGRLARRRAWRWCRRPSGSWSAGASSGRTTAARASLSPPGSRPSPPA